MCQSLDKLVYLKECYCSSHKFSGDVLVRLGASFSLCHNIEVLDISKCSLGVKLEKTVTKEALKFLTSEQCKIKKLIMHNNNFDSFFATYLMDALQLNSSVKHLDISSNQLAHKSGIIPGMNDMLKNNRTIVSLNISFNNIQSAGLADIFESLPLNQTLDELYLDGSTTGNQSMMAMEIYMKNFNLTKLYLNANYISDATFIKMGSFLATGSPLQVLHVRNNIISAKGVEGFCAHVGTNNTLKELDLSGNAFENEVRIALKALLDTTNIESVEL